MDKLSILTEGAKYDAACSSSGSDRNRTGQIGNTISGGCCHSFSSDGRCVTLLKVLFTNVCIYDCQYCVNRRSNDLRRTSFTPRELAGLTIEFYRRNYIEGLFLSSAVAVSPDHTTERMIATLALLRQEYGFSGYIHAKAIPGTDPLLLSRLGQLCDRLSVNIELPSEVSLSLLAPDKNRQNILRPMSQIQTAIQIAQEEKKQYPHAPNFAPAGQSTQMIVGATEDSDFQILRLTEGLYQKFHLKRVYYSAYVPVSSSKLLPSPQEFQPPLLREHRLYQADWLLRFYHFKAEEILSQEHPSLNPLVDPKATWALNHMEAFPVEVNRADYRTLLRVPGIGPTGARRILSARRWRSLDFDSLKKLGIVLKRAQYFITCSDMMHEGLRIKPDSVLRNLVAIERPAIYAKAPEQLSLFDS
jgi:putative DNA modification/repair radical SAM protein